VIRRSWEKHRDDLSEFFNYPPEIRKAVYTANAIESLNYQLRKVTRNRLTFVNDDAIFKVFYLAIRNASKKRTMPIKQWGIALNQVSHFVRKRAGSALVAKCYLHKTSDRHCYMWNRIM
jgi:transposase-like protein